MSKMIAAYEQRIGVASGTIRLVFDGQRIPQDATPEKLGLEENDRIDAMAEQTGGYTRI
jgi:hypothetical protein